MGPSWALRGWGEESLAGWASFKGCSPGTPHGLLVLAHLSLRLSEAVRPQRSPAQPVFPGPQSQECSAASCGCHDTTSSSCSILRFWEVVSVAGLWGNVLGSQQREMLHSSSRSGYPWAVGAGSCRAGLQVQCVERQPQCCGKGPWMGFRQQGRT